MIKNIRWLKWGYGAGYLALLGLLYLFTYLVFVRRDDAPVVEIYFADRMSDAHRILIDEYNKLHEGKVKVIPIDFPNKDFTSNERKEILARSLRGEGDGIDLLAVDIIWVQRFAKWCEPLSGYFSARDLQRIIPEPLYSCYADGELYAVPLDLVEGVMYYREDLLRKLKGGEDAMRELQKPMTWPAFLELKRTLNWKGPFYVFPAAEYEGMVCTYIENLLSLDPDYFSTTGFMFETPEGRRSLQLMVDLLGKDKACPQVAMKFTEFPSYEYFIRNDGLFVRGWNSFDKDFQEAPVDSVKESHLRKAPLPYLPGGRPAAVFGGWNLMVPKFSPKKDAVIDFVKFLLSDQSQEIFYTKGGFYPVVSSFYSDSSYLRKYPEIPWIKSLMRSGVHRPPKKDYTNYSKIMARYIELAMKQELPVDQALKSIDQAIQSEKLPVVER